MASQLIMITCPATQAPVFTGYRSEPGTSLESMHQIKLARCPRCGGDHVWNGSDAYWVKPEAPKRRGLRHLWRALLYGREPEVKGVWP